MSVIINTETDSVTLGTGGEMTWCVTIEEGIVEHKGVQ